MDYKHYSEKNLINLAKKDKLNNKELNKEWRKRYGINFPYKLHESGTIINCILNAFVGDRQMDKLILYQANKQRQILKRDKEYAG